MRKIKTIILDDRGSKRTFRLEEMSAMKLEGWLYRAALVLSSVIDVKADSLGMGEEAFSKVAREILSKGLGNLSKIDYDKAKPLLDELLLCCYRVDGGVEQQCTPDVVDGFIEDVRTVFKLRLEALKINLDFFGESPSPASSPSATTISIPRGARG